MRTRSRGRTDSRRRRRRRRGSKDRSARWPTQQPGNPKPASQPAWRPWLWNARQDACAAWWFFLWSLARRGSPSPMQLPFGPFGDQSRPCSRARHQREDNHVFPRFSVVSTIFLGLLADINSFGSKCLSLRRKILRYFGQPRWGVYGPKRHLGFEVRRICLYFSSKRSFPSPGVSQTCSEICYTRAVSYSASY